MGELFAAHLVVLTGRNDVSVGLDFSSLTTLEVIAYAAASATWAVGGGRMLRGTRGATG